MAKRAAWYLTSYNLGFSAYDEATKILAQTFEVTETIYARGAWIYTGKNAGQDPGNCTLAIRACDGTGKPTGPNLCSGTFPTTYIIQGAYSSWAGVNFDNDVVLSPGTRYALCLYSANPGILIGWGGRNGTYPYPAYYSLDGGSTWAVQSSGECCFSLWGNTDGKYEYAQRTMYNSGTYVTKFGNDTIYKAGQQRIINECVVYKVGCWLKRTGNPSGNVSMSIYRTSDGALLGTKELGLASSISTSFTYDYYYYEVEFDSPISVDGDSYVVAEIDTLNDASNYLNVICTRYDEYPTEDGCYYDTSWHDSYDAAYIISYLNVPPDTPSNVSPTDGDTELSSIVELSASAYSGGGGLPHTASQWQVTTVSGDYTSPFFDSGQDSNNLESISVAGLEYDTTYYWHVRYRNAAGWSGYSTETSFSLVTGCDYIEEALLSILENTSSTPPSDYIEEVLREILIL